MIEGKQSIAKQMWEGLTKWLKVEQVIDPLKMTSDRDALKVMIS